jgi:Zinc knuckle
MKEVHARTNSGSTIVAHTTSTEAHQTTPATSMDLGCTRQETKRCTYCNRFDHMESECRTKKARIGATGVDANAIRKEKMKCFCCGKLGHFARECTARGKFVNEVSTDDKSDLEYFSP